MTMAPQPILYSFRRCPYAMRARWAVLEAGLLVRWREVELKAKPAAMLEVSPKGTVPVLVLPDGTTLEESVDVMRWALEQADPRDLLRGQCPGQHVEIHDLIKTNDGAFKHHLDRFKYTDRYPGACKQEHHQAGLEILHRWSQRIDSHGNWLLEGGCSLADVALFPFVRQWRIADPQGFDRDQGLRGLRSWLQSFLDHPGFERLMQRADPWTPGGHQPHFPADAIAVPKDQSLFHLALGEDWLQAERCGLYATSTRGQSLDQVGFIHLSWRDQVSETFRRFYADAGDVRLLTVDPTRIQAPLRADAIPSGELFPHLYGAIPVEAVTSVTPYPSD